VLPVEIFPAPGGHIVLRARGSELLILADHVTELKTQKEANGFTQYFLNEALINRPARKLFEAWLRKDRGLWRRIYDAVKAHTEEQDDQADSSAPKEKANAAAKAPKAVEQKTPSAELTSTKVAATPKKEESEVATKKTAATKTTTKKTAATKVTTKKTAATKATTKKTAATKATTKKTAATKATTKKVSADKATKKTATKKASATKTVTKKTKTSATKKKAATKKK
jgi:hypothetical protein